MSREITNAPCLDGSLPTSVMTIMNSVIRRILQAQKVNNFTESACKNKIKVNNRFKESKEAHKAQRRKNIYVYREYNRDM